MERKLLPIGVDNFHKLITHQAPNGDGYLFVDKTMLIQTLLASDDEAALVTRPRRFGKTINMSMLQHFLAAEVNGNPTQGLFEGLATSVEKLRGCVEECCQVQLSYLNRQAPTARF